MLTVDRAGNDKPLAAVLAPQVAALAADYGYVLGPSTTFGKDLMPRVAAQLGVGQVSDLMSVVGPRQFKRPVYAGNAIMTVEVPDGITVVATVRAASFKPAESGASASILPATVAAETPSHTRDVELRAGGGTAARPADSPRSDLRRARCRQRG